MVATAQQQQPSSRRFVPKDLDVADFDRIEPLYRDLLARATDTPEALEHWLLDASELHSVIDEYGARRYIDKSCHTDDKAVEAAYLHFIEHVEPKTKPLHFALQRKFMQSPARGALDPKRYGILQRNWSADVEIFRDENVPLQVEEAKLVNEYNKTTGAMTVFLKGAERTLQQASKLLEEPDRTTRQWAWETVVTRRYADRERIDGLFDQIVPLRDRIATNAGLPDFRGYVWKTYKRFDYTPADCLRFGDAIAAVCVPAVKELNRRRAADLRIERVRPWDLDVDPKNRPPLRPFAQEQIPLFLDKTKSVFHRLTPELADDFESLRTNGNLDLDSRKGKQPGGYQASLEESRQPFIFMNATGTHRDVVTMLHEAGHAFHYLASRDEPLVFLRGAPIEFCEVASMGMELLGGEHWDVFYDGADAARARRKHLEGIVRFFPWMAIIDGFQHWLYTHPRHARDERTAAWVALLDRFEGAEDWSGYEEARAAGWQRQLHLFGSPFYYVEYGIAQLGALQLWMKAKDDPRRALANYRAALALGGTRPLPDLFAAAGISFDFSEKTLRPLINAVREELASLPA